MIPKETIDQIFEAARIEEIVGDFVSLKKRGVNYIGNCPFHNETNVLVVEKEETVLILLWKLSITIILRH